jgi:hypothetical protein
MLALINILLGVGLLVAGRRLFWLFVAAAGFVVGVQLTLRTWNGPEWLAIVVGIIVGILFALLAIFVRWIAIWVAGFLAGGSILVGLAAMLGIGGGRLEWVLYIVGGIIGLILVSILFDWAIITLSSLAGASLIIQTVHLGPAVAGLAFLILVIVGVVIQGAELRGEKADG